ncbi:hypothetical protein SDC9_153093 [bioreactor metagenome]|uniref:Uncharacterized protein n=1 Tax=bioreactor metagenome TaxID=1076179 RepID=A0A645EXD3_9ZZZZ
MDDLILSRLDLSLIVRTGLSCKGLQSGKVTFKLTALVVVPPQTVIFRLCQVAVFQRGRQILDVCTQPVQLGIPFAARLRAVL